MHDFAQVMPRVHGMIKNPPEVDAMKVGLPVPSRSNPPSHPSISSANVTNP